MRARKFYVGHQDAYAFRVDKQGAIAVSPRPDGTAPVIGGQTSLTADFRTPIQWTQAQEETGNNEKISDGKELYAGAGFGDPLVKGQLDDALWGLGNLGSHGRLLEVGCGPGFLLREFAEALPGWQCEGLDPSHSSVEQARAQGLKCTLGNLETASLQPGIDAFVVMGNFQLHPDPAGSLRRMAEVANPGALMFLDSKNPLSAARRLARRLMTTPGANRVPQFQSFAAHALHGLRVAPTANQLRAMLQAEGWEVKRTRSVPPRLLRFDNSSAFSRGPVGVAWSILDTLDRRSDERAWIQISARLAG